MVIDIVPQFLRCSLNYSIQFKYFSVIQTFCLFLQCKFTFYETSRCTNSILNNLRRYFTENGGQLFFLLHRAKKKWIQIMQRGILFGHKHNSLILGTWRHKFLQLVFFKIMIPNISVLLCSWHCVKHFIYIISFILTKSHDVETTIFLILQMKKWGL